MLDRWRLRAEAVLTGLLAHESHRRDQVDTNSDGVPERLHAALSGEPLPAPVTGGITVVRHADGTGCRLVITVDRRDPAAAVLSGFTVLDDRTATIRGRRKGARTPGALGRLAALG